MLPWKLLATARVPGAGEMHLYQRDSEFSIRVDVHELMNSRASASEQALASIACDRVRHRSAARVLIGGLGMGYTLAAALRELGPEATVVVAELVPEVIAWNRGPLGSLAGHPLNDPRVRVREDDVAQILRSSAKQWDAILLDVDNGPATLTTEANGWLYGRAGLVAAREALRPGGVLGVWSGGPDTAFTRRLRRAGFSVEEIPVRGRGADGSAHYLIWLATA